MVDELNKSGELPFSVKLAELAESADAITKIVKEVNYRDEVVGVITWMHTFSPAKM
jgi:L-arabinose isomerase